MLRFIYQYPQSPEHDSLPYAPRRNLPFAPSFFMNIRHPRGRRDVRGGDGERQDGGVLPPHHPGRRGLWDPSRIVRCLVRTNAEVCASEMAFHSGLGIYGIRHGLPMLRNHASVLKARLRRLRLSTATHEMMSARRGRRCGRCSTARSTPRRRSPPSPTAASTATVRRRGRGA